MQSYHKKHIYTIKLSDIYLGPIKSFFVKPWGYLHNPCSASRHTTYSRNVEWRLLAIYACVDSYINSLNRKAADMSWNGGEGRRKMWKTWVLMNGRRKEYWLPHSLLRHSLSSALQHPLCLSNTTSTAHITHFFSLPSLLCVLQMLLFILPSLLLPLEAHVHSVYHRLSKFI